MIMTLAVGEMVGEIDQMLNHQIDSKAVAITFIEIFVLRQMIHGSS